jgi:hypothetical protein
MKYSTNYRLQDISCIDAAAQMKYVHILKNKQTVFPIQTSRTLGRVGVFVHHACFSDVC